MCHCCAGRRQWPLPQARGPAERAPALTTHQAHQPALNNHMAQVMPLDLHSELMDGL